MSENRGNVIRIAAPPKMMTSAIASLRSTVTCVRIRRHWRSSSTISTSPPPYLAMARRSATSTRLASSQVNAAMSRICSVWSSQPRQLSAGSDVRCTAIDEPNTTSAALTGIRVSSAMSQITALRRPMRISTQVRITPSRYAATTAPATQASVTARFVAVSSSFSSGIR